MIFKLLALASVACAAPFPYAVSNQRKWIKINEVEHEVPAHLSPEQFRQQMSSFSPSVRIAPLQVRQLPAPLEFSRFAVNAPSVPLAMNRFAVNAPSVPVGTSSFHVGFQPQPVPIPVARPALVNTVIPQPMLQSIPQPIPQPISQTSFASSPLWRAAPMNVMGGTRQWVKLMEGTTPIEVPVGRDPQEFLQSIKLGGGARRFLSGKHAPLPIITKSTTTYEIVPVSKGPRFAPPPPPVFGKMMPSPKGKMAPPPVYSKGKSGAYLRPMYVAARPIGKW